MTTPLAIAATSEVLRFIIESAMTEAQTTYSITAPKVTIGAPPRLPPNPGDSDPSVVNLFLHSAVPNPALRSHPGPARDAAGNRLNNAPLVLNLQYLLSAHGPATSQEIGLGTAMHALHQVGIVPRALIRDALAALKNDADDFKKALGKFEPLADQLESLTISTVAQDMDALTKIWTATQAPMRPSATYLVTTVFLERVRPVKTTLPALGASLAPATLRQFSVRSVTGRKNGKRWPLTVEAEWVLSGEGLADADLKVTLGGVALEPVAGASSPQQLVLKVPAASVGDLRAGELPLVLTLWGDVNGRRSPAQNLALDVLLRPTASRAAGPAVPDTPANGGTVTGSLPISVVPPVARTQQVILRLSPTSAGRSPVAIQWVPPTPVNPPVDVFSTLSFDLKKVAKGSYLMQLDVDGVASQPMPDGSGVFQPQVTL